MFDRSSQFADSEGRLADLARRDAQRATPEFSQSLHGRIIRAVREAGSSPLRASMLPRRAAARYWVAPLAIAASLAFVAAQTGLLRLSHDVRVAPRETRVMTPPPAATPEPPVAAIEGAVHQANVRAQDFVQTAMAQQQWAGLDHDVRAATEYLVDQVPFRSAWESEPAARDR